MEKRKRSASGKFLGKEESKSSKTPFVRRWRKYQSVFNERRPLFNSQIGNCMTMIGMKMHHQRHPSFDLEKSEGGAWVFGDARWQRCPSRVLTDEVVEFTLIEGTISVGISCSKSTFSTTSTTACWVAWWFERGCCTIATSEATSNKASFETTGTSTASIAGWFVGWSAEATSRARIQTDGTSSDETTIALEAWWWAEWCVRSTEASSSNRGGWLEQRSRSSSLQAK